MYKISKEKSMKYLSPNAEVTLKTDDGSKCCTFYPSKMYEFVSYNHAFVYVKSNDYPNEKFAISINKDFDTWTSTTSSGMDVG